MQKSVLWKGHSDSCAHEGYEGSLEAGVLLRSPAEESLGRKSSPTWVQRPRGRNGFSEGTPWVGDKEGRIQPSDLLANVLPVQ